MVKILETKKEIKNLNNQIDEENENVNALCEYKTIRNFIVTIIALICVQGVSSYILIDFYSQAMELFHEVGSITTSEGIKVVASESDFRVFNGESISVIPSLTEAHLLKNKWILSLGFTNLVILMGFIWANLRAVKHTLSQAGLGMVFLSFAISFISFISIAVMYFYQDEISIGLSFSFLFSVGLITMIFFFILGVSELDKGIFKKIKKIRKLKVKDFLNRKIVLENELKELLEKEKVLHQDERAIFEAIRATEEGKLSSDEINYIREVMENTREYIKRKEKEEYLNRRKMEKKAAEEMAEMANDMFGKEIVIGNIEIENT